MQKKKNVIKITKTLKKLWWVYLEVKESCNVIAILQPQIAIVTEYDKDKTNLKQQIPFRRYVLRFIS